MTPKAIMNILPLQMHDPDHCPEELWGALDGPLEDGKIHGVHVCTIHGDDPYQMAEYILTACNAYPKMLEALQTIARYSDTDNPGCDCPNIAMSTLKEAGESI